MKKKNKVLALLITVMLVSSACAMPAPPPTASTASSAAEKSSTATPTASDAAQETPETPETQEGDSLLEQMDALYAQLDTERLPLQDAENYITQDLSDTEELPPQLVLDEPTTYMLSNAVRNLLYFGGNVMHDFDDVGSCYRPALLKTALYHTQPIDFWRIYENESEEGVNKDHVVYALVKQEKENGREPSDVYYAEDVQNTIHYLYGEEAEVRNMDNRPYYYFEKPALYTRQGDFGGPAWRYPQITNYQKTENGYICEAVLVYALDKDLPMEGDEPNGPTLTRENFAAATVRSPKYRYTFRQEPDGRLVLTAFKTLTPPLTGDVE